MIYANLLGKLSTWVILLTFTQLFYSVNSSVPDSTVNPVRQLHYEKPKSARPPIREQAFVVVILKSFWKQTDFEVSKVDKIIPVLLINPENALHLSV